MKALSGWCVVRVERPGALPPPAHGALQDDLEPAKHKPRNGFEKSRAVRERSAQGAFRWSSGLKSSQDWPITSP